MAKSTRQEVWARMKPLNALQVMLSFLKVGAFGFGGGAALVPIIEKELVESTGWMEPEKFGTSVIVASISPASLPVSICAIWNSRYAHLSAYSYALPGSIIYMILLTGFSFLGDGIRFIGWASAGIVTFILLLLYLFVGRNFAHSIDIGIGRQALVIMIAAFMLNGGTSLGRLINMAFGIRLVPRDYTLFSLQMIDVIIMAFFIIIFTGASPTGPFWKARREWFSKSKLKFYLACALTVPYMLAAGQLGVRQGWSRWKMWILIGMAAAALSSVLYDIIRNRKTNERKPFTFDYKPMRNLGIFLLISGAFAALVYMLSRDLGAWDMSQMVFTSALTSFGGGEVYYAIAESTFVDTGFLAGTVELSETMYTSRIVGIAGAMPGPVIVAIVAGIGFTYGVEMLGSVGLGWMFGIMGVSWTVSATAFGALSLHTFFGLLRESPRLKMILRYIMPAVCGMLIPTAMNLWRTAADKFVGVGVWPLLSLLIILAMFFGFLFMKIKRVKINDALIILYSGLGTFGVLYLLEWVL
jgi:chromate transporter